MKLRHITLLRFICGYQEAHGYSPSFRECSNAMGADSPNTASLALNRLERAGFIRRLPNRARAIEVLRQARIPRAPDGAPLYVVQI